MMFAAGGSRTKANAAEARAIAIKRSSNAVHSSASAGGRAAMRAVYNIGNAGGDNNNNPNTIKTSPRLKSKFTERLMAHTTATALKAKAKIPSTANANRCTKSWDIALHPMKRDTTVGVTSVTAERKKPPNSQAITLLAQPKHTSVAAAAAAARLSQPRRVWNSNLNCDNGKSKLKGEDQQLSKSPAAELVEPIEMIEIGIQAYEREITNYDMLVGDNKFMLPSREIVQAIEKKRGEDLRQKLLKTERQFEEHSEHFGQHVSNLKEFLETGKITRRKKMDKSAHDLRMDHRIMQQMDEFLKRKIPKAESMTNIKERIKKKEKELLNMFDTVENIQI